MGWLHRSPTCPLPNIHLTLEIGFGNGEVIFNLAQKYPEQNFIGIEVHKPGVAHLFSLLKKQPLKNLKIYHEDAIIILQNCIPDNSLNKIIILFPDPWPKKRHHKRRLIQPTIIEILQKKLKPKGLVNIATDCEDYATHIQDTFRSNPNFTRIISPMHELSKPERIILTKFEKRGKKLDNNIFELLFVTHPNSD